MIEIMIVFVLSLFMFSTFSAVYVYKFRGETRFQNFSQFIRKGSAAFTPFNCFLYLMSEKRAQKPIMVMSDFKELQPIVDNWEVIQKEARALWDSKFFEQTKDPKNDAFYDIGFRTFYKYGWGKFYLNWYGYTHQSALNTCPKTIEILKQIDSVNGAMFSVLPSGSKLTLHSDPLACSLRFHLGLDTPEKNNCFINIDGTDYSWRNGEAFLFDETYLHHANNHSDTFRLILMCDVDRPMNIFGRLVNKVMKWIARITVVPNTEEDERGLTNIVFSTLSPILKRTKELKKTNLVKYKIIKWVVNITLLLVLLSIFTGLFFVTLWFGDQLINIAG